MAGSNDDVLVNQILQLLNIQNPIHEYVEDDIASNLYVKNEQRLKILVNLMSLFSEEYRNDLEKSNDLEWELVHQLHILQLWGSYNKIAFVKAECSVKDQRKIFENIVNSLICVQTAKQNEDSNVQSKSDPGCPLILSSYEPTNKANKSKNLSLTDGWKRVEEASQLIERYKHLLEVPPKKETSSSHQFCGALLADDRVEELCNTINSTSSTVGNLTSHHLTLKQQVEPSTNISNLHRILVASKEILHNTGNADFDVEIVNPRRYLEDITNFKENSFIINLNTNDL